MKPKRNPSNKTKERKKKKGRKKGKPNFCSNRNIPHFKSDRSKMHKIDLSIQPCIHPTTCCVPPAQPSKNCKLKKKKRTRAKTRKAKHSPTPFRHQPGPSAASTAHILQSSVCPSSVLSRCQSVYYPCYHAAGSNWYRCC